MVAFARRPYEGLDVVLASRTNAGAFVVMSLLVAVVMPFDPPNRHGEFGFAVAGGLVAVNLVAGIALFARPQSTPPAALLLCGGFAAVEIGILVYLSGGGDSAYVPLFFLPIVFAAAVQPLWRWVSVLVFVVAVHVVVVTNGALSLKEIGEVAGELPIWGAVGALVLTLFSYARWQSLRLAEERSKAEKMARIDSLTGIGNRRGLWESLNREVAWARRQAEPLTIVLADLDHFKSVNDTLGHPAGDALLVDVSAALVEAVRASDRVFRSGGDEFAVVLRDQDLDGGRRVADRMRAGVERVSRRREVSVSLSAGVARFDPAENANRLLKAADAALYEAKRAGRDRTATAG